MTSVSWKPSIILLLFLPILASLGFFHSGCGSDDATSPESDAPSPLVTGTVDDAGGELIHEEVVLTIPRGALEEAADLAIHVDSGGHPFAEASIPVYRITGLPSDLNSPVTLRICHGLTLAEGDSLTFFLGEEREAFSGGSGLSWRAVAGRDSSGWCIAELERGALALGRKNDGELQAAVAREVRVLTHIDNHFRLVYRSDEVARQEADQALLQFENTYQIFHDWGFRFGADPSIWPLDVNIRIPAKSIACYIAGPAGKGYFDFDPCLLQPGVNLIPIIAHEVFHSVQSFYDPREPAEWGSLNQERLWLDEATASWLEAVSEGSPDYSPFGLNDDNLLAPMGGITGYPGLSNEAYGYGMVSFIRYLVSEANPTQGNGLILEIFQHFATGGDVTDAIDDVLSPPVSAWCLDMQRQLVEGQLYPQDPHGLIWLYWDTVDLFGTALGSQETTTLTVPDLGANVYRLKLQPDTVPPLTTLMVEAGQADPALTTESILITVYGRESGVLPVRLAAGVDSLNVANWPLCCQTYEDILVMVSRPFSTAPGHEGKREIEVAVEVEIDPATIDVACFNHATIQVRTDNVFNTGDPVPNDGIIVTGPVNWTGSGYFTATATDTFAIHIDPGTLALGNWYGSIRGDNGGNYLVRRLGGLGVPLSEWSGDELIYRIGGLETCNYLTHVFESLASDPQSDPYSYLVSYSCRDGEASYARSGIYLHLYKLN